MVNKDIMRAAGFSLEVTRTELGRCPFCNQVVNKLDLKDALSLREFKISGLCQTCQDETFKEPTEED